MATWEWAYKGKTVRGEGETEEEAWNNFLRSAPADPGQGYPVAETKPWGDLRELGIGLAQGVIDPVEGLAQLAEHVSGVHTPMPDSVRNWFRDLRKRAQSTRAGQAGEIVGNIGGLAIPGSVVARGVGLAGKGAGLVGRAVGLPAGFAGRAGTGLVAGVAEPVQGAPSDEAYWHTKANQAIAGLGIGSTLGPVASGLAGIVPPVTHFGTTHPLSSLLASAARGVGRAGAATGRVGERIAPGTAAAASTLEEQRRQGEQE